MRPDLKTTRMALLLVWISAVAWAQNPAPALPPSPVPLTESATGTVTGHVYCADTNGPCRFASVILEPVPHTANLNSTAAESNGSAASSTCALDGSFTIQNVRPGNYYIVGELRGYRSVFGDLSPEERNSDSPEIRGKLGEQFQQISVEANATTSADLRLERGAAINGTVHYDDGSPAINLQIRLYRRPKNEGWRDAAVDSSALFSVMGMGSQTDDQGHYRQAGLAPGTYTVEAVLPETQVSPSGLFGRVSINARPAQSRALQVYFGNSMRLSDALPLDVGAGEQRNDADIVIPTNSLHMILGTVTAKSDGHAIGHGKVSLLDPEDDRMLRETDVAEDGSFRFDYVPDGSYVVDVSGAVDSAHGLDTQAYEPLDQPLQLEGDLRELTLTLVDQTPKQAPAQ